MWCVQGCWPPAVMRMLELVASQLLAAQYYNIPFGASSGMLHTGLFYVHFVSQVPGMWAASLESLSRATPIVYVLLSAARSAGLYVLYAYLDGSIAPVADWVVVVAVCLYMLTGGFLVSLSFTLTMRAFEGRAVAQEKASHFISCVYFLSLSLFVAGQATVESVEN